MVKQTRMTCLALALSLLFVACDARPPAPQAPTAVVAAPVASEAPADPAPVSATSQAVTPAPAATPAPTVTGAPKVETHETAADANWDAVSEVLIALNGTAIETRGPGVTAEGARARISAPGVYRIKGALDDGQIRVETQEPGTVRLILDGVDLRNARGAAIDIVKAEKAILTLADGSRNTVRDGANYVFETPGTDEPNAAIFSDGDLTIDGRGALSVTGAFNDGIASKDGLVIASGDIAISAADDGIRGKDYVIVHGGALRINAGGDGIKSDDAEDPAKGYITIDSGTFEIEAGGDGIAAQTEALLRNGAFTIKTGGGSARGKSDKSMKGVKAGVNLTIAAGTYTIDSADDALHANSQVALSGGAFVLSSGDDGIHGDAKVRIDGGTIDIARSYEGIESTEITVNGGSIRLSSADDGVNVAGGNGGPGGRPGRGDPNYNGPNFLYVNGGTIVVNSEGDGIDANGAVVMTGGTIVVNGPTARFNAGLDFDAFFSIANGTVVAAGSSGMAQTPGAPSTQSSVLIFFASTQPAGTLVHIRDSAGAGLVTFAPAKDFQTLAFSSPALQQGAAYEVVTGGAAEGAAVDGLYADARHSGGDVIDRFTVSGVETIVGTDTRRFRGPRP
jgi:hypothetical protein